MVVTVRRENFKGKYFIIHRDRGKIVGRRRWSPKTFNLFTALSIISKRGTIVENERRVVKPLVNVQEIILSSKKPRAVSSQKFQYFIIAASLDGNRVESRSKSIFKGSSIAQARSQALRTLQKAIALQETGDSDQIAGEQFLKKRYQIIDEGIVYYRDKIKVAA